jgi:hypothetical protein
MYKRLLCAAFFVEGLFMVILLMCLQKEGLMDDRAKGADLDLDLVFGFHFPF